MRLLEKEPDGRYQSAAGVAHDLKRLLADPAAEFPLGERDFPLRLTQPSRLVDRDREIAALTTALWPPKRWWGGLTASSDGPGLGATFTVGLPLEHPGERRC